MCYDNIDTHWAHTRDAREMNIIVNKKYCHQDPPRRTGRAKTAKARTLDENRAEREREFGRDVDLNGTERERVRPSGDVLPLFLFVCIRLESEHAQWEWAHTHRIRPKQERECTGFC